MIRADLKKKAGDLWVEAVNANKRTRVRALGHLDDFVNSLRFDHGLKYAEVLQLFAEAVPGIDGPEFDEMMAELDALP